MSPIRCDRHRAAGNPTVGYPEWRVSRSIQSTYRLPTTRGVILSDIPAKRNIPRTGRPPVGAPVVGSGTQFESIATLAVLLPYHILVPTGEESILILPVQSILFYHQPIGGESYGLDNHLAANELAPKPNDRAPCMVFRPDGTQRFPIR